ncbi:MAG: hypothetical protein EAZ40_10980 [Rhodobacterales bacterium]|nr:MAG: hypothetical protein EAZ40_10980 [Rhodobacterales bacterium]
MHRHVVPRVLAIAIPSLLPAAAQAAEVSLSFGATIASEYVSSGIRYSDGVTVQPYVELGFGGLYGGAYISNLDADLTGADRETGLSLGYRGEAGSFSYDVSVNYYLYNEAFEDFPVEDYAEAVASGTFAATDTLYMTGEVGVAPEFDQTNLSLRLDYYTAVEGLALDATFGRLEADYGAWSYWSVGATYQLNDNIGLGLAYHDSNVDPDLGLLNTDGLFVASLSFDFGLP